ncbi:crossover junction endonuclease MUS81-like [Antedon mediterranea]|uniref:crossover junction endonuclease MUS81-like n=1 Tax=Antedon mediterranea TaxID=105859 RepID=UPI003AF4B186
MGFSVKKLFIQWLTEWKDEAQAQSWKSQYTYGKALRSLKKYPLPVQCGQDVKILEFFGDKLCKMLDKKLATYKEENGLNMDVSSESEDETPATKVKKRKKPPVPSAPKEYIPAYRSGPYALILTLYQDFQDPYSKGFMKKPELQKAAQELSEKSMTVPDPGCRYTAWSSMSTLITKGLVAREGNPSRYTITPEGCTLAQKLEVGHDQARTLTVDGPIHMRPVDPLRLPELPTIAPPQPPQAHFRNEHNGFDARQLVDNQPHTSTKPTSFQYTYVDDKGREVCSKDSAEVLIDDNFGVGFLVKCIESELIQFNIKYLEDSRPSPPGMRYVYIDNDQATDICPGIQHKPKVKKRPVTDTAKSSVPKKPKKVNNQTASATSTFPTELNSDWSTTNSNNAKILNNRSDWTTSNGAKQTATEWIVNGASTDLATNKFGVNWAGASTSSRSNLARDTLGSHWSDNDVNTASRTNENGLNSVLEPEFFLHPETFEIILCVDNCEIGGASKRKKQLLEGLQKNNIALDVRKLQVGDFLWVAREKQKGVVPQQTNKEAVLDYVIERKRMDDLCGSIKDGRFKEQKFRLKQCGISNPIYLVEDFGSMDNMSLPKATMQQAIVNTQVVDKFYVKQTCGIQDSVAYLTVMTRYLQSSYSSKTIKAYTRENFEKMKCSQKLNNRTHHVMSFYEFNENSIKNKVLTTGEVFAKQLLQFSGLTAEKAQAIIQLYPTVSHLLDAYSECETEKECLRLLSTLKCGKTQRNLGPMLSGLIHRMYATPGPLS